MLTLVSVTCQVVTFQHAVPVCGDVNSESLPVLRCGHAVPLNKRCTLLTLSLPWSCSHNQPHVSQSPRESCNECFTSREHQDFCTKVLENTARAGGTTPLCTGRTQVFVGSSLLWHCSSCFSVLRLDVCEHPALLPFLLSFHWQKET